MTGQDISSLPADEQHTLFFNASEHKGILLGGVPQEYISLTALGINPAAVRGLSGYELAEACRKAAVVLETRARWFEECEDAYFRVYGHDGKGGHK